MQETSMKSFGDNDHARALLRFTYCFVCHTCLFDLLCVIFLLQQLDNQHTTKIYGAHGRSNQDEPFRRWCHRK